MTGLGVLDNGGLAMAKSFSLTQIALSLVLSASGTMVPQIAYADNGSSLGAECTASGASLGTLAGTHLSAGASSPMILMVPGSGPTNRDGNSPQGLNTNAYKLLAEALCARSISSVRVDKRGMFGSAEAGDPNAVTVDLYAQDYRSWVDALIQHTGNPCIYLLGHSEGAIMVSAAAIGREDVCGLILLAGPGQPFGDLLRTQLRANPANASILNQAFNAIERLENGEYVDVSSLRPVLRGLFAEQVQDFLISIMSVDPAELARIASKPTLIVQGERDLQVSQEDAERLAEFTGGELVLLPRVNHVLKEAPRNRSANLATYQDPDLPVAEGVIAAIDQFVQDTQNG